MTTVRLRNIELGSRVTADVRWRWMKAIKATAESARNPTIPRSSRSMRESPSVRDARATAMKNPPT